MVEDDGFADGHARGHGREGEVHVGCLVESGVVSSYGGGEGFDPEEEEAVGLGDGGSGRAGD